MNHNILLFGLGYTAQDLAPLLVENNFHVDATTRNRNKIDQWRKSDIHVISNQPKKIRDLIHNAEYLLVSAPPDSNGIDPMITTFYDELIKSVNNLKWIGYLSSTSVYGDHHGEWVTETSPHINPTSRGLKRANAEESWLSFYDEFDLPVHIFRLAGIYGPNRNSLVKIINGKTESIVKRGQYFSRVHVRDISRALLLSMQNPTPGEIYNLADDLPSHQEDVDDFAAELLGRPHLKHTPFSRAKLSPMAKQFYHDCRRVNNKKFKKQFNFEYLYPTYKEGLTALYKDLDLTSDQE